MNTQTAIVVSAAILGGSVLYGLAGRPPSNVGQFQMVKAGDTSVWVLDSATGSLQVCGYSTHTPTAERPAIKRCFMVERDRYLTDAEVGITPPEPPRGK
ncbi:hypothetical protein HUE56_15095 [Azospirillum oryzae]|uniref:Uncharacterized protein n=1 Tax=Azospirillum oryzae TaxID=286727 RepID=A0A6N1AJH5_9PROT|nr:hypothetical protein [Azospirillum oryzae]KAA0589937.1 hypothetical protein FZ938_10095 [Azospirillum oryzae]QKS51776.1 hypothetical protein HUE56_15095 [Azospirillum oryzae]GLR81403.1 hypothetical protein GCM10007856_40890 [Azospirillum oryzae]